MYYMHKRPDVKIHQLDNVDAPHLTARAGDDCVQTSAATRAHAAGEPFDASGNLPWEKMPESKRITKTQPTTLRALTAAGKLTLDGVAPSALGVTMPD
jgi:hypothetical protein